jgi:hypothetical protein
MKWIYIDTRYSAGDPQHLKVFATSEAANDCFSKTIRKAWHLSIRSSVSQIRRRPTWSPIRPPKIPAAPPRQPLAVANTRLLHSVSRTTDLDHAAPHASAPCIRIDHLAPSEGRQRTKARSGKSYVDA